MITEQDVLDGECSEDEYEAYQRYVFRMWLALGGKVPDPQGVSDWRNYTATYEAEPCELPYRTS